MVEVDGEYQQCPICLQEYADDGCYPPGTTYTTHRHWWVPVASVVPHKPGCPGGWHANQEVIGD